ASWKCVPDRLAPEKLQLNIMSFANLHPVRSAYRNDALAISAPAKSAPRKSARSRRAFRRRAPENRAPLRFVLSKLQSSRSTPSKRADVKSQPDRSPLPSNTASRKSARRQWLEAKLAYGSRARRKSAPSQEASISCAPLRSAPARIAPVK